MENYRHKYQDLFDEQKCCVIIPTYNNDKTLKTVIEGVLNCTRNVIVVNDGATDNTPQILTEYTEINIKNIYPNKGKGNALNQGFKKAMALGYDYAVTIDSDGQHDPAELPEFLEKISECPDSLIVGARNMEQESVPGKSSFGHKFSNFWYFVETGLKLPDTQSGYRLYPLNKLKKMKFYTRKFEFEIEVLVRATWKGVNVTSIPVTVSYGTKEERVSHFRPFKDFTRVSILNTVLVPLALLFFLPRLYFRRIVQKGWREVLISKHSNLKISQAIGFGVFMGIFPIWGYQMIIGASLAHVMKLNKVLVLIASNISIPPMIPLILYLSFKVGELFVNKPVSIVFEKTLSLEIIKLGLFQYIVGSIIFALITGILAGLISIAVLYFTRKR